MLTARTSRNLYGILSSYVRVSHSKTLPPARIACSTLYRSFSNRVALTKATSMGSSTAPTIKRDWKRTVSGTRAYSDKPDPDDLKKEQKKEQRNEEESLGNDVKLALVVSCLLLLWYRFPRERETSFSLFLQHMLPTGEVKKLMVNKARNKVRVFLHEGANIEGVQATSIAPALQFTISGVEQFEHDLIDAQEKLGVLPSARVPIIYARSQDSSSANDLLDLIILLLFLYMFLSKRRGKTSPKSHRSANPFSAITGANPTIITEYNRHSIQFKNVAGMKEAKQEVMEFVDYLKNPERFTSLGGRIPKGALLFGPPGTGKTMLARAIAAEANVPFLSMSGTDFIERIGGIGASRMRDLFRQAREMAPCILYIDEIDTVGKSRSQGMGYNTEQEQTLNQLLVEMDGIDPLKNVVVMASTNRKSVLDAALLRPGRFDRQVEIQLPTLLERKEIFEVYLQDIVLDDKIKLEAYASQLAAFTPKHSGADIANIVNEAAIIAARNKGLSVTEADLHKAIERVIAGLERKNKVMTPEEKRVMAYHQAGHVLTGWMLEHTEPVLKISITPRAKGEMGYAQHQPTNKMLQSKEELLDKMCMILGGKAAEALIFKTVTSGAQDDLKLVTTLAYFQVAQVGMSPTIGHISIPIKGKESYYKTNYSQKLTRMIDEEVRHIVNAAYCRAESLLTENTDTLKKLAEALLEKEVLYHKDIVNLAGQMPYEKKIYHLPEK